MIEKENIQVTAGNDVLEISRDNVNSPNHYQGLEGLEVQTIFRNFIPKFEDAYVGGAVMNVVKYSLRSPRKGNLLEDLKKARKNLDFAIEYLEK